MTAAHKTSGTARRAARALAGDSSVFLVTVAWPEGAGAWGQEASSGHL